MAPRAAANRTTGPFAGFFDGDVRITGKLYLDGKLVRRLGWLDWIISGIARLDAKGKADVSLPKDLIDSLEDISSYQLTAIGGAAPDLHVAQTGRGKFKIAGGPANGRVSWHVSGTLKDKPEKEMKAASDYPSSSEIRDHLQQTKEHDKMVEEATKQVRAKRGKRR